MDVTPYENRPSVLRTLAFSDWERRARGWEVWPYPVEIEPPFVPFYVIDQSINPTRPVIDDGRHETLLSTLTNNVKGLFSTKAQTGDEELVEEAREAPLPEVFAPPGNYVTYTVAVPKDHESALQTMMQCLQSLRYAKWPIGWEIIGSQDSIVMQCGSWDDDCDMLCEQLRAHFPDVALQKNEDQLATCWQVDQSHTIVDFGLEEEAMLPLATTLGGRSDPLTAIIGAMSELAHGEVAVVQVLFMHVAHPWGEHFVRSLIDGDGTPFFSDAPDMLPRAKEKVSSPLLATTLRIATHANKTDRSWQIAKRLGGGLAQFDASQGNRFMPLTNDDYPDDRHEYDLLNRTTHRSGMILSLSELTGLVHLPDSSLVNDKLLRMRTKTKRAPELARGHDFVLGDNLHRAQQMPVTLSKEQRTKHMYLLGASGTGKSTLMLNCLKQDIEAGEGVAVLDPHGDLIDDVLRMIPEDRIDDVVLLDPSDPEFSVGFNILDAHSELENTLLASDLTSTFQRLSTSWGDQMNAVLANGILAFLESTRGGTLLDLRRFLIEKRYREEFLTTVTDPEVVYYWTHHFPLLTGRPQASVLTRLDTFLRPKPIRYMVAQQKSTLNFSDIMDSGKIFLARLSHGGIGEENSFLLGALLVTKFHQVAMARQDKDAQDRRHFWLYIDEFHNFITPSLSQTLSGVRKYNIGLILAHQELMQLRARDTEVASAVLSNPYTRICFRLGDKDAKQLADGFSYFDAQDLQSLGVGEAVGRIEQANYDFSLSTHNVEVRRDDDTQDRIERIVSSSRDKYSTSRESVEKYLNTLFAPQTKMPVSDNNKQVTPDKPIVATPVPKTETVNLAQEVKADTPEQRTPPLEGRGGAQHVYLQNLIQKLAHERGIGAQIEYTTKSGGRVDVVLKSRKKTIACEISVSTSARHECENIKKCLEEGFDQILVIAQSKSHLKKIKQKAQEQFDDVSMEQITFCDPADLLAILDANIEIHKGKSNSVRGYTVNVSYTKLPPQEQDRRRQAIAKVMVDSLRKMRG